MSQRPAHLSNREEPMRSPYRGLTPFTEADYAYFFGREREITAAAANLEVARLTLFYGPSGVGKTSVLRAGVLHQLSQRARADAAALRAPETVPIYFNRWQQEPVRGLAQTVTAAVQPYLPDPGVIPPEGTLLAQLQEWTEIVGCDLLLILDQFEEYFLYHDPATESDPGAFSNQLAAIANHPSLRVNLLISLREDALARLDHFKGRIPFLLDNRLSIGHLSRTAGRQALEAPLDQYNLEYGAGYAIEEALVEAVLDQVGSGQVALARQGSGSRAAAQTGGAEREQQRIEAPYLQLVMTRLWEEEGGRGVHSLRRSTLDELGGAEAIVRSHLDRTLDGLDPDAQALAARFLDRLVTPSGGKIALSLDELASYAVGAPVVAIEGVIRILQDSRVLRGVQTPDGGAQYEILHDVLGPALVDWQERYQARQREATRLEEAEKARREAEERAALEEQARMESQRRERLTRWAAVALSVLLILAVGAVGWALSAQQNADSRAREAAEARTTAEASAAEAQQQKQNADAARSAAEENAAEAERQKQNAEVSASEAEHQAGLALAETQRADERAEAADRASRRALAEQMAGQSQLLIHWDHLYDDQSLILARDAALISESPNTYTALRTAVDNARARLIIPPPDRSHIGAVYSVAYSPDGTQIVSGGADGTIRLWLAGDLRPLRLLFGHSGSVLSVGFSPDGSRIVSGGDDSSVRVWDAESGVQLARLEGHSGGVWSVGFSPDGSRIVSGTDDSTVRVWDVSTALNASAVSGEALARLEGHSGSVLSVGFSPDGSRIVSGGDDRSVRVWDAESGEELARLEGHSGGVWSVAWSPDGRRILSGADDSSVRVWDGPDHLLLRAIARIVRPAPILTDAELQNFGLAGEKRLPDQARLLPLMGPAQAVESVEEGKKLAQAGQIDEAVLRFEAALKLDPSLTVSPRILAEAVRDNAVQAHVFAASQLAGVGNMDGALARLDEAIALDPSLDPSQARQRTVHIVLQEGRYRIRLGEVADAMLRLSAAKALDGQIDVREQVSQGLAAAPALASGHCGLLAFPELADLVTEFCDQIQTVVPGEEVTGAVESSTGELWRLEIGASSRVTITLTAERGGFTKLDPYLTVYGEAFRVVAEHNDIVNGVNQDSELNNLALSEPGVYWIEAGRCCPGDDQGSVGAYRLLVVVKEE